MPRRTSTLIAATALALALVACSDEDGDEVSAPPPPASEESTPPTPSGGDVSGDLVVFAAASLTETFEELKTRFEEANPDVNVELSFGSSATLAAQINEAAPADVFAAASPATMKTVTDEGNADGEPEIFVRNKLQIATPADNPGDVDGLDDFTMEDLDIALCAAEVPCGAASDKVFTAAGITPSVDTRENDVKAVLTKVELGEVDAALVYETDVNAAGDDVQGIAFPEADDAINDYPVVVLKEAENAEAAAAWVEFIRSEEAQQVFEDAGFELP